MRAGTVLFFVLFTLLVSPSAGAEPARVCEPAIATCLSTDEQGEKTVINGHACPAFWCVATYAEKKPDDWLVCAWVPFAGGACGGPRTLPPIHDPLDPAGCQPTATLLCVRAGNTGSAVWADAKTCVGAICEYALLQASSSRTSCGPPTGNVGQACGYYSEVGTRDAGICKYDHVRMPGHYHCVGTATLR